MFALRTAYALRDHRMAVGARRDMNKENHQEAASRFPAGHRLRHIHHSPLFWVGVVLFLAAITIYVLTDDLSWRPHLH
jgi:hypothetical protein